MSRTEQIEWFKVEDEKPGLYKRVLVKLEDGQWTFAEYVPYKTLFAEDYLDEDVDQGTLDWEDEKGHRWVNEGWFEAPWISEESLFIKTKVIEWAYMPKGSKV